MIKLLLTPLFAIGFTFPAFGQTTITQTAMPTAGDTLRYSTVNPIGVSLNIGKKGPNQTWDYSSLVSNGQDIYNYVAANKTPYFFYFLNQLALKTADSLGFSTFTFRNIYSFYTKNSSVFKAEGLGYTISGIPLASKYSDDDEIYQFPLEYNDSDISTFHFLFTIPGQSFFSYVQAGRRINDVDGWGSITTPYKTYPSVLRVKTTVDQVDTIITTISKTPVPRKQVIYKWLSNDEHIPVLEITGTEVGNTFTASQIRYRDAYNGKANPLAPRAKFTVDKVSGFANADTFSFTDQTTPFATGYQWQITPSASVKYVKGTSATTRNPKVIFTAKGVYSVVLVASSIAGTDDTTAKDLISIGYGAGVNSANLKGSVAYPNPAADILHLPVSEKGVDFAIFDIAGNEVQRGSCNEDGEVIISVLPSGTYLYKSINLSTHFIVASK